MKTIIVETKDICQEFNGKIGTITYTSLTFTKKQFPKSAAIKARHELSELGITNVNVYNRKSKELAVDKNLFEKYLEEKGISHKDILEPFLKIICY